MKRSVAEALKGRLNLIEVILEEVSHGPVCQNVVGVRVLRRVSFRRSTVNDVFYFLKDSAFIVKGAGAHRAPYGISKKGKLLLEALS
jgi:predicted transcriptional regulator